MAERGEVWVEGPGNPSVGWRQPAGREAETAAEWFREVPSADRLTFHAGDCGRGKVGGDACTCQPRVAWRDGRGLA